VLARALTSHWKGQAVASSDLGKHISRRGPKLTSLTSHLTTSSNITQLLHLSRSTIALAHQQSTVSSSPTPIARAQVRLYPSKDKLPSPRCSSSQQSPLCCLPAPSSLKQQSRILPSTPPNSRLSPNVRTLSVPALFRDEKLTNLAQWCSGQQSTCTTLCSNNFSFNSCNTVRSLLATSFITYLKYLALTSPSLDHLRL
jgi:hypothetical protein